VERGDDTAGARVDGCVVFDVDLVQAGQVSVYVTTTTMSFNSIGCLTDGRILACSSLIMTCLRRSRSCNLVWRTCDLCASGVDGGGGVVAEGHRWRWLSGPAKSGVHGEATAGSRHHGALGMATATL
jgi:hypothetical protein